MKSNLSKKEVQEKIDDFFSRKKEFDSESVRKIKRLSMKYNIKLGRHRKLFCKKCYADLRKAKVRVNKEFKKVKCGNCGARVRWKTKSKIIRI